eukprot:9491142-Heterocapsa_arctica.AAC.1
MSSTRLREPDRFSDLPAMDASDAQWIVELHMHQDRCGPLESDLLAVVYRIAIDLSTDSVYPDLTADPAFIKKEKARREDDRAKVTKYLGARPLPSPE